MCAPHLTMRRYFHSVAVGLAHALLAGDTRPDALAARASAAMGTLRPQRIAELIGQLFPIPAPVWERMTVDALADRIARCDAFHDGLAEGDPPYVRRWILRPTHMHVPPLGLDGLDIPQLDHAEALVHWLGMSLADLDWFTAWPALRRDAPLQRQHYAFAIQPKRTGGMRLIESPRARLKAVQARIHETLLSRVPVHEACHGFVRERSVKSHASLHQRQEVVIRFDLQDFFTTVGIAQVRGVFTTLGYPAGVARDLATLCTVMTPESIVQRLRDDGAIDWHQAKRLRSAHLPQGAPSSPMLANLCAFRLDLRLDGLAQAMGARYSRYADDMVFSGPAALAAAFGRLQAWVGRIALEEGYRLNHRKTRLMTQATAQTVCGVVVNERTNLRRTDFDRLRAILHRCATQGPMTQTDWPLTAWRDHLHGRVTWAEQLNPEKAKRLRALWNRIDWSAGTATIAP